MNLDALEGQIGAAVDTLKGCEELRRRVARLERVAECARDIEKAIARDVFDHNMSGQYRDRIIWLQEALAALDKDGAE